MFAAIDSLHADQVLVNVARLDLLLLASIVFMMVTKVGE
jgi:hypothetical protein